MLDLIISSYKLIINMSSYLKEYTQYPVDYTYNKSNCSTNKNPQFTVYIKYEQCFFKLIESAYTD